LFTFGLLVRTVNGLSYQNPMKAHGRGCTQIGRGGCPQAQVDTVPKKGRTISPHRLMVEQVRGGEMEEASVTLQQPRRWTYPRRIPALVSPCGRFTGYGGKTARSPQASRASPTKIRSQPTYEDALRCITPIVRFLACAEHRVFSQHAQRQNPSRLSLHSRRLYMYISLLKDGLERAILASDARE